MRIAVSVVSGLCCVLVTVLWVRSYWRADIIPTERLAQESICISEQFNRSGLQFDPSIKFGNGISWARLPTVPTVPTVP